MKIKLNGTVVDVNDGAHLSEVIAGKNLDPGKVLASVNKDIIKAEIFSETVLAEGDEVELFCFVSGG